MTTAALRRNLGGLPKELGASLDGKHVALAAGWVLAALLPVTGAGGEIRALAWVLYFATAVVGLNFVMGLGNMASIGHGAFVAVGALVATLARTRASAGFLTAVLAATLATAAAAFVVGHGAVRLRAVHLAVSSWLGAWLTALFLTRFPGVSGGAQGLVVPDATVGSSFGFSWRITPVVHYEAALLVLALVLILFRSLRRSSVGLTLATIKQNPREAAAIGTLRDDVRLKVFVFGSAVAGLVGALGVHLSGIFDPRAFGVLLSVTLFLAVLLGGPGDVFGPVAGAFVVAVLPIGGQPLIPFVSTPSHAGELMAGVLLLAAVAWRTATGAPRTSRRRDADTGDGARNARVAPASLVVEAVTKRFGGVTALDGVHLAVEGGRVHGIMGPNGSGKSTLLAIVSGHLFPDEGRVLLDGRDVTRRPATDRLRDGIARSLQSTELFPDLTALEHLEAASLVGRRYTGFVRASVRTPLARAEESQARREALSLLEELGLSVYADTPASALPAGDRRLLTIGAAIARGRVVLLDEPSAGMSPAEIQRAAGIISELREKGVAVVVVEHNMRLLRRVADVITVLDGGRVIATGDPSHVYEHPEVRAAYLGTRGIAS